MYLSKSPFYFTLRGFRLARIFEKNPNRVSRGPPVFKKKKKKKKFFFFFFLNMYLSKSLFYFTLCGFFSNFGAGAKTAGAISAGRKRRGDFGLGRKRLGRFRRGENGRGDFSGAISTVSRSYCDFRLKKACP